MLVTVTPSLKFLIFLHLPLQLPSWDIENHSLSFPDGGTEKKRDHNSTSLMYLNWFQSLSYREHRCHEMCNEACQDICWSPLVAHQRLQDNSVLAIYVAAAALAHALKNNVDVISSSLRDREAWTISRMLPAHIVKGLCLEDGLRGLSHCLDSKDLTTPSNLTTGWLGRGAARLPRDSHSLEPGWKVPEVSCEDADGMASAPHRPYIVPLHF